MNQRWWLIVALVVGAALRTIGLLGQNVWLDEAFSLDLAREPLAQMLRDIASGDAHPPLFYLALHALDGALRWPLEWYRVLLLPFGLATIALTWWLGRHAFSFAVANIAAFAVALAPLSVVWDRLLRMYSVEATLAAGSWALLLAADSAQRRKWLWWAGYALAVTALVYVHYLGWVVLATQCAFAAIAVRRRWPALCAAAVGALAYEPWLPHVASQAHNGGRAFSDAPVFIAADILGWGLHPQAMHSVAAGIGAWLFLAAVVGGAAILGRRSFLPFALAAPVLQLMLGIALQKNLLLPRYFTYDIWAAGIALAVVLCWVWERDRRLAAVAAGAAAGLVVLVADAHLLFDPYYQFTDWRAIARIVAREARPGDIAILDQGVPLHIIKALPGFAGRTVIALNTPEGLDDVIRLARERAAARVWYVENQPEFPDPQRRLSADLQSRRRLLHFWMQRHADVSNTVLLALFDAAR